MAEINFKQILQKEGINISELPEKYQRKAIAYDNKIKHPFSYKKGTQELTPKAKQELDDLNEDIIDGIYDLIESRNTDIEAQEKEKQRLKAEEEERLRKEEEERKAAEEIAKKKSQQEEEENEHFTTHFLGWGKNKKKE